MHSSGHHISFKHKRILNFGYCNQIRIADSNTMYSAMILIFLLKIIAGKAYTIADTSMFGNCVLHIKRFRDSSTAVDTASIFIQGHTGIINHRMVSIFSANETRTIKPVGKIREGCSLNMIIGVSPNNTSLHDLQSIYISISPKFDNRTCG
jgi:hypothetical protein